jgi:hypothetical protein
MGIRQILRTNKGINAVGPSFGNSSVYIRRIRYTPYSAAAVADAYRCDSMFACYGALAPAPVANASMVVSVTVTPSTSNSGRRRLLQQSSADAQAALSEAVAAALPGVVSSSDIISQAGAYSLAVVLTVQNLCSAPGAGDALTNFQVAGVQYALINGLDADLIPPADQIYVQSVTPDASGCAVAVSLLISGYNSSSLQTDFDFLSASGSSALTSTALAVNNILGAVTTVYLSSDIVTANLDPNYTPTVTAVPPSSTDLLFDASVCPSYPLAWDATCVDAAGNPPAIWCATCVLLQMEGLNQVVSYAVSVEVAETSVSAVESALSAALFSNAVVTSAMAATPAGRRLLSGGGSFNVSAPNGLLATRVAAATTSTAVDTATCAASSAAAAAPRAVAVAAAGMVGAAALLALL